MTTQPQSPHVRTTLAALRDQAVANVDERYGYAIEQEPGYEQGAGAARRAEYDEEEDRLLGELPLIEAHRQPQPTPQEYDCGCVAVLLITDADYRDGGKPFEMRLLHACGRPRCRVHLAPVVGQVWQSKRRGEEHRHLTIEYVSGDTVWPRRNTSRRRQSMSVTTLRKDYRLVRD